MSTKLRIFILMMSFSHTASAITLEDAQKKAVEANPQLRALAAQVDEASWKKLEVLADHLPQLHISARRLFDEKFLETPLPSSFGGGSIPAIEPYTMYQAQATWRVFDGFATWNRYQAARLNHTALQDRYDRARSQLATEVRLEFYRAVGAQLMVAVAKQNVETLEHHLGDVKVEIRNGVSTKYDSLRIEVQLQDAHTEKMAADDNLILARQKFWQTLGVQDDGQPLQGKLPDNWDESKYQNVHVDRAARADLDAAIHQEKSAHKLANASKGYWVPSVDLFGEEQWYNNLSEDFGGPDDDNFKTAYKVGVLLTWSLFDGGKSFARQAEATARSERARQELRALNTAIPVDVEFWKRRLLYSIASFKSKQLAIEKAQESVRLARNGKRAGARTNTEVLDAELDLNRAKAKEVTAKIDAVEAFGNLELAVGHPLP